MVGYPVRTSQGGLSGISKRGRTLSKLAAVPRRLKRAKMRAGLKLFGRPPTDLPMDHGSRMARAQDMGFWSRPWFHGSARDLTGFDLSKAGSMTGAESARQGVWLAADPE